MLLATPTRDPPPDAERFATLPEGLGAGFADGLGAGFGAGLLFATPAREPPLLELLLPPPRAATDAFGFGAGLAEGLGAGFGAAETPAREDPELLERATGLLGRGAGFGVAFTTGLGAGRGAATRDEPLLERFATEGAFGAGRGAGFFATGLETGLGADLTTGRGVDGLETRDGALRETEGRLTGFGAARGTDLGADLGAERGAEARDGVRPDRLSLFPPRGAE